MSARTKRNGWLTPVQVQDRYKIPYPQLLTVQLQRYPYSFPERKTGKYRKYRKALKVTKRLDEYLSRLNLHHANVN